MALTPEQRAQIKARMAAMTPEQRQKFVERASGQTAAPPAPPPDAGVISELPEFQKGLKVTQPHPYMSMLPEEDKRLPVSAETLTDALPAVGSVLGGSVGALTTPVTGPAGLPGGAAIGGGAGEAVRQWIRDKLGFAPGTGMTQEFLDLDPNSPEAMAAGIAAETLGGGLAEVGGKYIAGPVAKWLKDMGLTQFARSLEDVPTDKAVNTLKKTLEPVAEELPMGPRGRLANQAALKKEPAGEIVGEIYAKAGDQPSSFKPAVSHLKSKADELVETPAVAREELRSARSLSGETYERPEIIETLKSHVRDPQLQKAFDERGAVLTKREAGRKAAGEITGGRESMSILDVWNQRKQAGLEAKRAASSAFASGKDAKTFVPKAQASMAEYEGLRETLHSAVPDAKAADDVYHAWATMLDKATDAERGHFISRYVTGGTIPGQAGTIAGALAGAPALARSSVGVTGIQLAKALKGGNAKQAHQIFRAFIDAAMQPETEKVPDGTASR